MARLTAILLLAALASACEFVQIAPVPGVPVTQTQPASAPISTLSTQEICRLRLREGYFDEAIDELTYRGDFSDFELAQIRAARVAVGMGEEAVQCSFGPPQQLLTRSIGDEYDMAWLYDRVFSGTETRVFFANGVVARVEDYPRSNRASLF